ncbi:hypothetical protein VN97_g10728 [Penicillium thymicola]|uniref:Uncharacterized protein n=1 Tax=Penicillium thymicola TaxID=293382 RepID=A0AAI9T8F2_PENTH|nr:hypothetical protein VN97_g10728 [Penicillium thymicola]
MAMAYNNNSKLVVLIEADNAQSSIATDLLAEVTKYGIATAPHEFSNCSKFANFGESNRIRTLVSGLRIYGRFNSSKFANSE